MEIYATQRLKVEIDKNKMIEVAIAAINEVFNLPKDAHIDKKGYVVFFNEVSMGTHSSRDTVQVRKATEEDIHATAVLDKLRRVG